MARVRQTMTLKDEVSPVLKSIIKSMDATVKAMKAMDTAASSGGSSTAWDSIKKAIDDANDALGAFEKQQQQVGRGSQQVKKHLLSWGDAIFIANQGLQLLQQIQNMLGTPIRWADEMTALLFPYRGAQYPGPGAAGAEPGDGGAARLLRGAGGGRRPQRDHQGEPAG